MEIYTPSVVEVFCYFNFKVKQADADDPTKGKYPIVVVFPKRCI